MCVYIHTHTHTCILHIQKDNPKALPALPPGPPWGHPRPDGRWRYGAGMAAPPRPAPRRPPLRRPGAALPAPVSQRSGWGAQRKEKSRAGGGNFSLFLSFPLRKLSEVRSTGCVPPRCRGRAPSREATLDPRQRSHPPAPHTPRVPGALGCRRQPAPPGAGQLLRAVGAAPSPPSGWGGGQRRARVPAPLPGQERGLRAPQPRSGRRKSRGGGSARIQVDPAFTAYQKPPAAGPPPPPSLPPSIPPSSPNSLPPLPLRDERRAKSVRASQPRSLPGADGSLSCRRVTASPAEAPPAGPGWGWGCGGGVPAGGPRGMLAAGDAEPAAD